MYSENRAQCHTGEGVRLLQGPWCMWVLYWHENTAKLGLPICLLGRTLIFFMASPGLLRRQASVPQRLDFPGANTAVGNDVLQESRDGGRPPLRRWPLPPSRRVRYAPQHVPTPSHIAGPRCHRGLAERKFQHQRALADAPKSFKNKTRAMTVKMGWRLKMEQEAFPVAGLSSVLSSLLAGSLRNKPGPRRGTRPRLPSREVECGFWGQCSPAFLPSIKGCDCPCGLGWIDVIAKAHNSFQEGRGRIKLEIFFLLRKD